MARIILNTFGSLGDLHPFLAVAMGLRQRGHDAVIATSEVYRQKVVAEGVGFAPVRPDVGLMMDDADFVAKLWHPTRGSEFLLRDYLVPQVKDGYEDLAAACRGADLLLTHSVGLAGPIVSEKLNLPWLSVALQPLVFFSVYDPPIVPGAEFLKHLYRFGPGVFRAFKKLARFRLDPWAEPIQKLRAQLGLPRSQGNPLLDYFSPTGTLALFSEAFVQPQPDWPPNTVMTGFVYYDQLGQVPGAWQDDPSEIEEFLQTGPPPVLFTLGSSAVMHPGEFFRESIAAVCALGVRAVLLAGRGWTEIHNPLPDSIWVGSYLPFSKIMPRSAAIVHQGGIGTTAQALRAGRPMLVTPWSHDQPDNAARIQRLGIGRTIKRNHYYAPRVADELKTLLTQPSYAERANEASEEILLEDGITAACDAIEQAIREEKLSFLPD